MYGVQLGAEHYGTQVEVKSLLHNLLCFWIFEQYKCISYFINVKISE